MCWLDGPGWIERVKKFLLYYAPLKEEIGFQKFLLVDNGSSEDAIFQLMTDSKIADAAISPELYRFDSSLFRGGNGENYPYVWRAYYHLEHLMHQDWEKILIIDSDSFILSPRLAHLIRDSDKGFHTLWSKIHNYPASEISWICRDSFPILLDWMKTPWETRSKEGKRFETEVPYTDIHAHEGLVGDRYGFEEDGKMAQRPEMDFYTQARNELKLCYNWPDATARPH